MLTDNCSDYQCYCNLDILFFIFLKYIPNKH